MAKQWNKNEKLEILTFAELNDIKLTVQKYNMAKSTIHRWRLDAQNNFDNLEWGRGSQSKQNTKRRISILTIDSNNVKKMSRSELEEIAKLHFALKKYEAKTIQEKFFVVNKLSADYSVDFLCRKLCITRQGYYLWIKQGKPIYKKYNFVLAEIILEIFRLYVLFWDFIYLRNCGIIYYLLI